MKVETHWQTPWKDLFRQSREISRQHSSLSSQFETLLTPHIQEKIKFFGEDSPIGRQYLPSLEEEDPSFTAHGLQDPIADQKYSVVPGLIHRYPNRALYLPTAVCPVHCRYCFRRNEISQQAKIFNRDFSSIQNYLIQHPEINEIIYTGGDPLSLDDPLIEKSLLAFSKVPSIKYIRFHTRFLSTIPERIDSGFLEMLAGCRKHFDQLIFVIHINSPDEICDKFEQAIKYLSSANIQIRSQSVLLKNVNDNAETLAQLFSTLASLGVTPYYLHHADNVYGAKHFQTSLEEGRKIYQQLRSQLSGWMLPHYVIDLPSGGGKVPAYNPETFEYSGQLINRFGQSEAYHQS